MQTSQSTSSVAGPRWRFKSASSSLGDSSAKNVVLHVLRHCVCVCASWEWAFLQGVCACVCVSAAWGHLSQSTLQEYGTQWKNVNTVQEYGTKQTGKPPRNIQVVGFKPRVPSNRHYGNFSEWHEVNCSTILLCQSSHKVLRSHMESLWTRN